MAEVNRLSPTLRPGPARLARRLGLLALLLAAPLAAARSRTVTVAVAASLREAVSEAAAAFEAGHPGVRVRVNAGASGQLVRQVEQGAPVDLLIPASPDFLAPLAAAGRLLPAPPAIARNELVLIAPAGSTIPVDLPGLRHDAVRRIALGEPRSVPAGRYAVQAMERSGMGELLGKKRVLAMDVRQALESVASGSAQAGFVYRTDAATSSRVRVVVAVPPSLHDPIEYRAALVAGSPAPDDAAAFLAFLLSPAGQAILARRGFLPAPPPR